MTPTNLGDQLQVLDLLPVNLVAASADSAAIDLQAYDGEIAVVLDALQAQGVSPTMACKLTECDTSGGSYTDVAGGGFTGVASAASVQKISLNKNELKRYVKLNQVLGGTSTPKFYMSAKIYALKKYSA